MEHFIVEFPYLFQIPIEEITKFNFRVRAATLALQAVNNPAYTDSVFSKIQNTFVDQDLLFKEWMNLELEQARLRWILTFLDRVYSNALNGIDSTNSLNITEFFRDILKSIEDKQDQIDKDRNFLFEKLSKNKNGLLDMFMSMNEVHKLQSGHMNPLSVKDAFNKSQSLISLFREKQELNDSEFIKKIIESFRKLLKTNRNVQYLTLTSINSTHTGDLTFKKIQLQSLISSLEFLKTTEGARRSLIYDVRDYLHKSDQAKTQLSIKNRFCLNLLR